MVIGGRIEAPILAVLFACGCASAPKPAPPPLPDDKKLSSIEIEIGFAAELKWRSLYRVADDPHSVNRLRHVGRRMIEVTERTQMVYAFYVLDTGTTNALSFANGHIYFTRGLMEFLRNDDEIAAILGHELSHVNRRHTIVRLERQQQTLMKRILVEGALGLIPVAGEKLAYLMIDQGYDQEKEYEADRDSVRYMQAAGYDPQFAVLLMKRISASPGQQQFEQAISDHPLTADRIVKLEQAIRAPPPSQP